MFHFIFDTFKHPPLLHLSASGLLLTAEVSWDVCTAIWKAAYPGQLASYPIFSSDFPGFQTDAGPGQMIMVGS